MANLQLATSPVANEQVANAHVANEHFPHPMLEGYRLEERQAMLGVRRFLQRFLQRPPSVTEVVFAYHVLQRMR